MSNQKETITIVVNGRPVEVDANSNAPLKSLIGRALEESGNAGQPKENWELRDAKGDLLDLDRKISDFGFGVGITLFLNLKAGVGGNS
ncbi:MAG: hypothetical protein CYG59_22610 [Chloroflexi bacterium]|nr:MAG: hypothetical protein CYG59_22610 [Chloroflexota bacterium]